MWKIISRFLGLRTDLDADSDSKLNALSSLPGWFLIALLAGIIVYYAWQYRKDGRRLTAGRRYTLTAIRIAVIVLVVLMLIRPALNIAEVEKRPPSVAVMLDASLSMNFPDVTNSPLTRDIADPAGRTRFAAAKNFVHELIVKHKLNAEHRVYIYRFSDTKELLATIPPASEKKVDLDKVADDLLAALGEPTGGHTNTADNMSDVLRELEGSKLAAAVVVGDFRETSTRDSGAKSLEEAAEEFRKANAAIFPVCVGGVDPLRDLIVKDLIAPKEANLDDVLRMQAVIINNCEANLSFDMQIVDRFKTKTRKEADDLARRNVRIIQHDDGTCTVERHIAQKVVLKRRGTNDIPITLIAEGPEGEHEYVITAPIQRDEYDKTNNTQNAFVKIVKRTLRSLFIAGSPTIEYHYIWPALVRDPIIDVSCWLQDADVNYVQQGNQVITQLPTTPEQWLKYDVVILYDIDPEKFTNEMETGLEQLISKGGGLFMIAGRTHGLDNLLMVRTAKMGAMLPVDIDRNKHVDYQQILDKPIKCRRTDAGQVDPVFMFDMNRDKNDENWEGPKAADGKRDASRGFPMVYWAHPTSGLKRGAVSLLEKESDSDPYPEDGKILMARWRYGLGSVFYSGINELWRWRYPMENYDYDRYFTQIIRYLGETRLLGSQKQVVLTTDRKDYTPGADVQISLAVLDPATLTPLKAPTENVSVTVKDPEGAEYRVSLQPPAAARDNVFRGQYKPLRVGNYSVRATHVLAGGDSEQKSIFDETSHFQTKLISLEDIDSTANLEGIRTLTGIAGAGSRHFDSTNLDGRHEIAQAVDPEPMKLSHQVLEDIWDSPLFLALVLMLISAEWVLRKKWSLL